MRTFWAFWRSQGGATSIEYALIGGIISIAIVVGATSIGTKLNAKFLGPVTGGLS